MLFVITSSDVGGTETFLRELVLRLDRDEFEPIVCSLRPNGRAAHDLAAAGARVLTLDMSDSPRLSQLIRGVTRLAGIMDALQIDLVQAFLYRANVLASLAARFARRRPVVVIGQRSLSQLGGRQAVLAARLTRRLCDRVVAVSETVRDDLISNEGVRPEQIVVIENGVDTARFVVAKVNGARLQWKCPPETVIVGGVGRLAREKGFAHLVGGIDLARARGVDVTLLVAGDGPERPGLEHQAKRLNGYARFLGVHHDPRQLYAALDIFVLPSLEEGLPNALLEAMACGCAVVASRVGGVPEIVEHERSGLLVEPGSPTALADAMVRLAKDGALRLRLGREAVRRVRERFDIVRTVERHADLYRALLSEQR